MININCKLKRIFKIIKLQSKSILISKSKRTLQFYKKYWSGIQKLIADDIKTIILR